MCDRAIGVPRIPLDDAEDSHVSIGAVTKFREIPFSDRERRCGGAMAWDWLDGFAACVASAFKADAGPPAEAGRYIEP